MLCGNHAGNSVADVSTSSSVYAVVRAFRPGSVDN